MDSLCSGLQKTYGWSQPVKYTIKQIRSVFVETRGKSKPF